MEGLIPMIYKSLKNNKTPHKYERLSSKTPAQTYSIDDHYTEPDYDQFSTKKYGTSEPVEINSLTGGFGFEEEAKDTKPKQLTSTNIQHRVIDDHYTEPDYNQFSTKKYGTPEPVEINSLTGGFGFEEEAKDTKPRQLVRFRSRRLFSRVTGA